jgi:C-terminal processing protease CtpA/Prc
MPKETPPVAPDSDAPKITVVEGEGQFPAEGFMGLTFGFQKNGSLVVTAIRAGSIGEDMGLKAGDKVIDINEKPAPKGNGEARVVTEQELAKLAGAPAGSSLLMTIERASDKVKMTLTLVTLPALPDLGK